MPPRKSRSKKKAEQPEAAAPEQSVENPQMMQPGQPGMMPGQPGMMPGQQPGMMPGQQPGMMPGQQPGMMPGQQPMQQPGMMQPGMMQPGMMQPGMMMGNPMMAMMQMMQGMMGGGMGGGMVDPAALPFASGGQADEDLGLDAEIIRPATLTDLVKTQEAISMGSVLDMLCLAEDGEHALGGVPKGCTMTFVGPPGKGKTRTALAALARVALDGYKVGLVVAEEGFYDEEGSGRDDLCSRLVKIGMAATGLDEKKLTKKVLEKIFVLEAPYHRHQSWDDFVTKYRYLVEKEEIEFIVIDSLNTLDPTKHRTADNLSALKTYNHEQGLTCICIGQIRDTGQPVGGEALQHTADAVFLIEEMSLGSKEIAAQWGGKYREKIDVIRAVKSVTTKTFPHPIRLARDPGTGALVAHEAQPQEYAVLPILDS
jgi:KaiC/GvpD/RAD55 family RecA-like ATPase